MSVSYTIDVAVNLEGPVTVTGDFQKSSMFEFDPEGCDTVTARCHLAF